MRVIFVLIAALGLCLAQQAGTSTAETHPPLITAVCSSSGCTNYTKSVTMDANWRWLHNTGGYTNCYSGNTWSTTYCTDPDTCASSCALDGCAYSGTYGVTSSGTQLRLNFVTGSNVGSRLYLMATNSNTSYEMFKLLNKEFTFDVDVSQLACGLNGALYFVEMDETGNLGVGNNKAGAFYGTGYCDAQCPHDVKFIKGQANIINWTTTSTNSGKGKYGSCCGEMDIWEANKMSTAYTAHNCLYSGLYRCSNSTDCGDSSNRYKGVCDKDGCDWNHYRMGNTDFYGESKTVDTTSKFTVVTQFVTDDGTSSGNLVEIRRYYKQNGVVIANSFSTWSALSSYDSLTDASCVAAKTLFGDTDDFTAKGGMTTHGKMLSRGVVLVLSLWDDYDAYMLWLDSNYPTTGSASTPGVARGSCSTSSGVPSSVESTYSSAYVIFSNIRVGDFGTTASGVPVPGTSSTATPATAESSTTVSPTVVSSTVSPVVESSAVVSSASEVSSAENSASSVAVGIASILALAMTIVA